MKINKFQGTERNRETGETKDIFELVDYSFEAFNETNRGFLRSVNIVHAMPHEFGVEIFGLALNGGFKVICENANELLQVLSITEKVIHPNGNSENGSRIKLETASKMYNFIAAGKTIEMQKR